jgi:hypothetical protein
MSNTLSLDRKLSIEAEAARALLANIRDVVKDDEDAAADAIEGETNLIEAITATVERLLLVESFEKAIDETIKKLQARKDRFANQGDLYRAALASAMGAAELKKVELACATLSRKPTPAKVVITEEADIPSAFWKPQPPRLDKKAVLDALKDKQAVPGATLSNGGETLAIRVA